MTKQRYQGCDEPSTVEVTPEQLAIRNWWMTVGRSTIGALAGDLPKRASSAGYTAAVRRAWIEAGRPFFEEK